MKSVIIGLLLTLTANAFANSEKEATARELVRLRAQEITLDFLTDKEMSLARKCFLVGEMKGLVIAIDMTNPDFDLEVLKKTLKVNTGDEIKNCK